MKKAMLWLVLAVWVLAGCAKNAPAPKDQEGASRKLIDQGVVFLKQSDPVKAVQSFAAAIKTAPDSFDGYSMLAQTLIHVGQPAQAEGVMFSAVKRFPNNGQAYYLLAVAQDAAGNLLPAIMAARKSVDIFTAAADKEWQQRGTILLAGLLSKGKALSEEQSVANAENDARKAVEAAANVSGSALSGVAAGQ